ncbi:MAG: hypothetical protein HC872_02840 [Gammaproteobacteria bacterium]|nr:hypothetical protein [Gammaproteobacteria bacterium]
MSPVVSSAFFRRIFTIVALALLAYALVLILQPFFAPIAWALLIAFLLHPLHVGCRGGWVSGARCPPDYSRSPH